MTAIAPSNSRGMGWRKPVPVFIPSPPVSRPTSDTIFTTASVSVEGYESKSAAAGSPQRSPPPPMPDNWRNIIGNVTRDVRRDSSRFQRGAGSVIHEPEPAYAGLSWTASSTTDDHCPRSPRSRFVRESSLPRTFRPPTPPIPSARRPKSYAVPSQLSPARPYRMIYPDPPSLIMKNSSQTLRRCSAPSLCLSESTRLPPSVNTRPSVQSLTSSSDDHTAVSSHAGTGSWYLPNDLQAEWDLGLALGLQNEKKAVFGSKEANEQTGLPMHHVPASKLRKTTKQRSCSGMLWSAMTSFGRGIMSLF